MAKASRGVIEHEKLAGVFAVPEAAPALRVLFGDVFCVVDQAHRAPGVGDGILVFRVVGLVAEGLVDILEVRDIGKVDRLKHILGNELRDHIIRRNDHIIRRAAGFELRVHRLVGVKRQIVDLDAGFFLKLVNDVHAVIGAVRDVLSPVVDGDLVFGGKRRRRKQRQKQREHQKGSKQSLFHPRTLLCAPCWTRFSLRACSRFITTIRTRITANISVNRA